MAFISLIEKSLVKPLYNLNKTFIRFRRIQTRRPVAAHSNFNEAAEKIQNEKELKIHQQKDELLKRHKQAKQEQKSKNIDYLKEKIEQYIKYEKSKERNNTSNNPILNAKNLNQNETYQKLQEQANRVYQKHDPYYEEEIVSNEVIDDIVQNVDFMAHTIQQETPNSFISKVVRLADGDHRFGPLVQITKSLKHRYYKKKILLEGKRLINDALESNVRIDSIFVSKNTLLNEFNFDFTKLKYEIKFFEISPKAVNLWSDVETSQGFIGECLY